MLADEALACYSVGAVTELWAAGGTAGRTWRVTTGDGVWLLRLRGARTSAPARLAFDHGLRAHLVAHDVPTVEAVRTRSGARWCELDGRVFELYPYVEGRPYDATVPGAIEAAGEALARFHLAAVDYAGAQSWSEPIGQYTALGYSNEQSDRLDDPRLLVLQLRALATLADQAGEGALLGRCTARAERLLGSYAGESHQRLARWVIHGDYTPANVTCSALGGVAGIFDLDWAMPGTRCRDLADGAHFFGNWRGPADGGDIWALTAARAWDEAAARRFVRAYASVAPLGADELRTIPPAFSARWLSIRLEGMAKVAPDQRWRFFARDVELPLAWLDMRGGAFWELAV
ncbi:MAG: phosphotransferase [Chloroflexi bacterium]|nr:phosphotransferase [Chloroflexota bacterium]